MSDKIEWRDISSYPTDALVYIRSASYQSHTPFYFDGTRWLGMRFNLAGPQGLYWDAEAEPVTHWWPI